MLIIIRKGGTGHKKCQDAICDVQKGTSDDVKADVVEKDKEERKIMDVKKYLDDKVDAIFNSADYDPTKSMCSGLDNSYAFFKVKGGETKTEGGKKEWKCDCGNSSTCGVGSLQSEKKGDESIDNPKDTLCITYTPSYFIFRLNGQVARFKDAMKGIEIIPYDTLDEVEIFCAEWGNNGASQTPYCADELVPFFNEAYYLLRYGGCFRAIGTLSQMSGLVYIFEAMKLNILENKCEDGVFTISGIKVKRYGDE